MNYNPEELKKHYDGLPHGKARTEALREAIEAADQHNDVPFRIYFREEMCHEACFYGDVMYMMVVFPEMLSIIDRYPDTPSTQFDTSYDNALDHILWIYKWVIEECSSFYQISMEDCLKFFEDFKKRSISYGYNLKPYYRSLYYFYNFDDKKAEEAFHNFERIPRDSNSDCRACERNTEIGFYLDAGNLDKAFELAEDIENFKLRCGGNYFDAWLRMKISFLDYYMDNCEFEKVAELAGLLERKINDKTEYQVWGTIMDCYAHTKPGRALRIYKKYWKELEKEHSPYDLLGSSQHVCCFWKQMVKSGRETVRLQLDSSFPLYNEDRIYKTEDLFNYYYNRAENIAKKFDQRNNADSYIKDLQDALENAMED